MMNIENKFNVGDKVFICGNLDRLKGYITIEPLFRYGELRKEFREILQNEITESVRSNIIEALKVKETEITDINVYITDTPKIKYRVNYKDYAYELNENEIYRTKDEALAIVEIEIKRIFNEIREKIVKAFDDAEEKIYKFCSVQTKDFPTKF